MSIITNQKINHHFKQQQLKPKCLKNQNCFFVCNSETCKSIPFLCEDQKCECKTFHKSCKQNMLIWENVREDFLSKKREPSIQLKKYLERVQQIYKKTFKQIERLYSKIKTISITYGLNEYQRSIYLKIKQNRLTELNGAQINLLKIGQKRSLMKIQIEELQSKKKKIQELMQTLIKILEDLTLQKPIDFELNSKITNKKEIIEEFFINNIKNIKLLYRASESEFSVSQFWKKCNNKTNTFTLLRTQFGKIIGGYTPLPWDQRLHNKYSKDENRQSFVFSITEKQKLPLLIGRQGNAIKHTKDHGPNFGGNNIYICDKANELANSGSNIGDYYNNGEYIYGSQDSIQRFCGQSNGRNFLIEQWEVHQIIFQ